nr:putative transposase (putative), gypsy type [Tanacetum cinerariifolium]
MPTGKIGVYTRFFEFANFRLPLSTFLVNVLRHYRINLSQLSVIATTKVSHFEILCRVHRIEPTVGLFRCFYVNSKNKGWMSFSMRPDSDAVADPAKVKVRKRERTEGKAWLLDSTVGRVVSLLPVSPARAKSELEASVERLFNEGGSVDQENVVAERPKRPRKKRRAATDASGSSYPPKKLRRDYKTSGEAATSGKSPDVLKELLASNMLNVEAGVAAVATLPMITSSVSATPEHESGPPIDSIIGLNLRTLSLTKRFFISLYSSHHSSTNAAEAGIDSFVRSVTPPPPVMTEAVITTKVASIPSAPAPKTDTKVVTPIHALMFLDSDSTGTVKPAAAGSSHVPG